jgi:hypothetical protein
LGPAGGVVAPVVPVVVVPVVVRFTPATPEAVVAPLRFFVKYQIAAATIARVIKIPNQLTPPLAGGGVVGAGVPVVWAYATEDTNRKARARTRFIEISSRSTSEANTQSSAKVPSSCRSLNPVHGECTPGESHSCERRLPPASSMSRPRSSANRVRPRLTRLLTVPDAMPITAAASS